MHIHISGRLLYDNEIQFYDTCTVIAEQLRMLATEALATGDCHAFIGRSYAVHAPDDPDEILAEISITA